MRKHFIFMLALSICMSAVKAQSNRIPDILNQKWVLEKETMSGVGSHHSLPEKTTLLLRPDYTWTASAPIDGVSEGKWKETGKETLVMHFAEGRTSSMLVQDDGRLRLTRTEGLTKTVMYWKRAGD